MRKRSRHVSLLLALTLLAFSAPARAQAPIKIRPYKRDPSEKALKWANDELRKMSLEEKVGQLISVGLNATFLNQDSEAFRTLKPGGRVVILEYAKESNIAPASPLHKMSFDEIRREIEPMGFAIDRLLDFLPVQHGVVFTIK